MEEHLELCRITFTSCHVELLRHEKKEPVTTDNEQANLNPQKMIKFSRDRKLIQASSWDIFPVLCNESFSLFFRLAAFF